MNNENNKAIIERWEKSGLSGTQFAKQIGIKSWALYHMRERERRKPPLPQRQKIDSAKVTGLHCPRCGCDIVKELSLLTMKLKALQNIA